MTTTPLARSTIRSAPSQRYTCFMVYASWFGVSGYGVCFMVSGFRSGVSLRGFGFRSGVSGLGFGVSGLGFGVWGFERQILSFGSRVSGLGFWVSGFGLRVSGFGLCATVEAPRNERTAMKSCPPIWNDFQTWCWGFEFCVSCSVFCVI